MGTIMWRAKQQFANLKPHGYWPRDVAYVPRPGYEPARGHDAEPDDDKDTIETARVQLAAGRLKRILGAANRSGARPDPSRVCQLTYTADTSGRYNRPYHALVD